MTAAPPGSSPGDIYERELVPATVDLPQELGVRLRLPADHEEGGALPPRLERFEHPRRRHGIGTIVEGEIDRRRVGSFGHVPDGALRV